MRIAAGMILLLISTVPSDAWAAALAPAVRIEKTEDRVEVWIGEEPFTTLHLGKELARPYFLPVRSEGGAVITRRLGSTREEGYDHPHHKGIWLAVDEVDGMRFWNEQSRIQNIGLELMSSSSMRMTNLWLNAAQEPLLIERTTITIFPHRLLSFDIELTPFANRTVAFGDTKEGMLGIRLADGLREKEAGSRGRVINADGLTGAKACWGRTSRWVDYHGPVGDEIHGVAIFDHPGNPWPSRYHVRDYGLFAINPFGERAYTQGKKAARPVELQSGERLRLRYGIYVHPGDTESAEVDEVYRRWIEEGSTEP